MAEKISGTREWAEKNANCCTGCSHGCRYCYACYNAVDRFHIVPDRESWKNMKVDWHKVNKRWEQHRGVIMFPTQHDITPEVLQPCVYCLQNILAADNRVLIVSKPHLECISEICARFESAKDRILFRFTIGARDNALLQYWEPGAPNFEERKLALEYAFRHGFQTSVSMEPCLDWENIADTFSSLIPFVTQSIWIGPINRIWERVKCETTEDVDQVSRIKKWQTRAIYEKVYAQFKDNPNVRWKESMKLALGLPLADKPGEGW